MVELGGNWSEIKRLARVTAGTQASEAPFADMAAFQEKSARLVLMLLDAIKMGPVTLKQTP